MDLTAPVGVTRKHHTDPETSSLKSLTQSWLDQLCSMIGGVTHAIVLMQERHDHDFTQSACWPHSGDTPPALLDTAQEAITTRQEVTRLQVQDGGDRGTGMTIACPVLLDSRMSGVVVVSTGQPGDSRGLPGQLRSGCSWLALLLRRESESGKHYLATMLEMAAMFLESRHVRPDDPGDPVITRIIDTLGGHTGTDTSTLLKQIHDTVRHSRGDDAGCTRLPVAATAHDGTAQDIVRALEEDRFVLHYQPKVELETGRISCMEALLLLDHPGSGLQMPEDFLPEAAQAGLMPAIDDWVLRTACRQLRAWQSAGHDDLSVAVNLSTAGFMQPRLVSQLATLMDETGIRPERLEIEVTELTLMDSIDTAAGVIRKLNEAGIRISVDDFGTGYSSLNYLQRLPISSIKIDRSFTGFITSDTDIATIVRGIIAMAHATGLEVIAEGVETGAQLAFLRKLQCDQFQGYYFSEPLEPGNALQLLGMEATAGSLLDYADQVS